MSTKPLISFLLYGLALMALPQVLRAEQEPTVAPATPHQLETIKSDPKPATETIEESKTRPGKKAQPTPASPHQEQVLDEPAMRFDRLDLNHDGRLTKAEAKGDDVLAQEWKNFDVDGDGSLSPDEVEKYFRPAPNR